MKIVSKVAVFALLAMLAAAGASYAGPDTPPPPPPPPPDELACSHGFWKNHEDLWWGLVGDPEEVLAMLKARGPGSEQVRLEAHQLIESLVVNPGSYCKD